MNNQEIRANLNRYWKATMAHDLEKVHEFYHDDIVVEFPPANESGVNKTYTS
jgi:ketosteroid isomerase-like protein